MKASGNKKLPKILKASTKGILNKKTIGNANKQPFSKVRSRYRVFLFIFNSLYRAFQALVIAAAFIIILTYAGMSVVNTNDAYKENIIEYITQKVPGITNIEDLSLGWDGIFPGILIRRVDWSAADGDISMQAERGIISMNPIAPLYGGSIIFVKLQNGYLLLAQDWLRPDSSDEADNASDNITNDYSSALNLDVIIEDYRVSLKENSALLLTLDRQVIRLRDDKQIVSAKGQLAYGVIPIMEFDASLRRYEDGVDFYAEGDNINLRYDWQDMLEEIEVYSDFKDSIDKLKSSQGSGKFWVSKSKEQGLSIKTEIQLEELSLKHQKNIDMNDIFLTAGLYFDEGGTHNGWELVIKDLMFNMDDGLGNSRKLNFDNIAMTKDASGIEIISPQLLLEDISYFAINTLTQENIIGNISGYDTRGSIENLRINIRSPESNEELATKFSLDGHLVDVTTNPVSQIPGAINISGDLAIRDNKGWFVLDDYDSDLYLPLLYPDPFHFGYVRGIFMWEWIEPGELLLVGSSYDIKDAALRASMQLSLYSVPLEHGYIDLEVGASDLSLQQTRSFIPWNALQVDTSQWLDKALIQGNTDKLALSLRGDVKYFGSDQTIFELGISLVEGGLLYREDKKPIEAPKFDVFMTNAEIQVLMTEGGRIGEIAQLESGYGVVDIRSADFALGGDGEINLASTPELLYDYVLSNVETPINWQARGTANGTWEFQYNLRSQEFLNANLNLDTQQSEAGLTDAPTYKITNITGSLGISSSGYVGDWQAYYEGEKVAGSFSDDVRGNVLKLRGALSIPEFLDPYISGKGIFNIEAYTKERGSLLLSDYKITSDMLGIELNLPYPLTKSAGITMPLIFDKISKGKYDNNYLFLDRRLSLGWRNEGTDIVGLEFRIPSKRATSLKHVNLGKGLIVELSPSKTLDFDVWQEVLVDLGLTEDIFTGNNNVGGEVTDNLYRSIYAKITEYLRKIPYGEVNIAKFKLREGKYDYVNFDYNYRQNDWISFSAQREEEYQVSGRVKLMESAYKVFADVYSIYILDDEKPTKKKKLDNQRLIDFIPKELHPPNSFLSFPEVEMMVHSVYYQGNLLGGVNSHIQPTPSKMQFTIKDSNIIGLAGTGEFVWELNSPHVSKLSMVLDLEGDIDSSYVQNIEARGVDVHFDWAWQGQNSNFHKWYDDAISSLSIESSRGTLVSDRANVLINVVGFLNLNSYVRAVSGDFSSWSNSNSTIPYRAASISMNLEEGKYVLQDNSKITLSFIKIDGSGAYALATGNLDASVTVTSPTTSVLPITALILGASALAPLLISIDIAGGDFINRFSSAVYRVNGTLANPQSSLVRISDVSGKKLDPDDLASQVDIRSRLDNFRF